MKKALYILTLIMATMVAGVSAQNVLPPEIHFKVNHQNYIQSLVGDAAVYSVSDTLYVEQPIPLVHTNIAEEAALKMFPIMYYASIALTILLILWTLLVIALIISLIVWVPWEACTRNGWHFKRHFLPILVYVSILVFGMFAATMIVGRCTSLAFIWDSIPIYQNKEGNKDLFFNLDKRKGYINWRWGENRTITIIRDITAIRIAGDSIYFKTDSVWYFPADSATITILRNEFREPNSVLDTVRLGDKVPYKKYIKNIEYISNPPALTSARWFWWREFFHIAGKWKLLALTILLVIAYYPARAMWQRTQPKQ